MSPVIYECLVLKDADVKGLVEGPLQLGFHAGVEDHIMVCVACAGHVVWAVLDVKREVGKGHVAADGGNGGGAVSDVMELFRVHLLRVDLQEESLLGLQHGDVLKGQEVVDRCVWFPNLNNVRRNGFHINVLNKVKVTRLALSQFWSIKIRRATFLGYRKSI